MMDPSNDPSVVSEDDSKMSEDPNIRSSSTIYSIAHEHPRDYGDKFCMSRTAPCKWSDNQTIYYRIHRKPCDENEFFKAPDGKFRQIQWHRPEYADFLKYATPEELVAQNAGQDKVRELLNLLKNIQMRDPSIPVPKKKDDYSGQETLTDQAMKLLLQLLGMERQGSTVVRIQSRLEMRQFGEVSPITIDTAVMDEKLSLYLLLVAENKPWDAHRTPFGQLMAGAIAAHQYNNAIRLEYGMPKLDIMIFPGIICIGTTPTFYRIKITQELVDAVKLGQRPKNDTYVAEYKPPIEDKWIGYGLWRRRNRPIIMKILENMKDFLPPRYYEIPEGWLRFMTDEEAQNMRSIMVQPEESIVTLTREPSAILEGVEDPDDMEF